MINVVQNKLCTNFVFLGGSVLVGFYFFRCGWTKNVSRLNFTLLFHYGCHNFFVGARNTDKVIVNTDKENTYFPVGVLIFPSMSWNWQGKYLISLSVFCFFASVSWNRHGKYLFPVGIMFFPSVSENRQGKYLFTC